MYAYLTVELDDMLQAICFREFEASGCDVPERLQGIAHVNALPKDIEQILICKIRNGERTRFGLGLMNTDDCILEGIDFEYLLNDDAFRQWIRRILERRQDTVVTRVSCMIEVTLTGWIFELATSVASLRLSCFAIFLDSL